MNDEFGKSFCDLLRITMWAAGVLVRQFELGREGYPPELISKEGRKALEVSFRWVLCNVSPTDILKAISGYLFLFSKSKIFPGGDFEMRVEIDEVRATKARDVHKVRFEEKSDYLKAKWMLSRIPITWAANDTTRTLYFLGKKFID